GLHSRVLFGSGPFSADVGFWHLPEKTYQRRSHPFSEVKRKLAEGLESTRMTDSSYPVNEGARQRGASRTRCDLFGSGGGKPAPATPYRATSQSPSLRGSAAPDQMPP